MIIEKIFNNKYTTNIFIIICVFGLLSLFKSVCINNNLKTCGIKIYTGPNPEIIDKTVYKYNNMYIKYHPVFLD